MSKSNIDWPFKDLRVWNPVIGCKRGCYYCWAKIFWKRFRKLPFEELTYNPDSIPKPIKKPCTFFVTEFTDPWYWSPSWFNIICGIIESRPHQEFIFLTKAIALYNRYRFPNNSILGLTDECKESQNRNFLEHFFDLHNKHGYKIMLSFEPLMGTINYKIPDTAIVIVGGMDYMGKNNVKIKQEWIDSIKDNYKGNIHFKKNIVME